MALKKQSSSEDEIFFKKEKNSKRKGDKKAKTNSRTTLLQLLSALKNYHECKTKLFSISLPLIRTVE